MLFDLRGRHRRRAVRVIYMGLALLMGVGLVGFGIGGGFGGGGLFTAASSNEGAGGASFSSKIKKYEKLTKQQPTNVSAWEGLTSNLLHEAGNEAYVSSTGAVTSKGKELYARVAASWSSYLALNPAKPNQEIAQRMLPVFGEEGLNQPAAEVQILQLVVTAKPKSAALYGQLALSAYKAKNVRVGDLASEKAVALAPLAERPRLKAELTAAKKNPSGGGEAYTATTNGKTFTVKSGPNGTFTGAVPATPAKKK